MNHDEERRRTRGITPRREDEHEESRRGEKPNTRNHDQAKGQILPRSRLSSMKENEEKQSMRENATGSRPRRRCNEGDCHERATLVTDNAMKGSQGMCNESKDATTRMAGLQGPGRRQRVARDGPGQSGSQVRVSANGEDGTHLPDLTCLNRHGATSV